MRLESLRFLNLLLTWGKRRYPLRYLFYATNTFWNFTVFFFFLETRLFHQLTTITVCNKQDPDSILKIYNTFNMEYIALTSWPRRLAGAWPRDAQTKAERMKLSTTIVCGQHYSSTVIVMMISDTWGRFNTRTFLSATGWSRRVFGGGLPLWRWRLKLNLGLAFPALHCHCTWWSMACFFWW